MRKTLCETTYKGEKYSFRIIGDKNIGHGGNSEVFDVELLDAPLTGDYVVKFFSCENGDFQIRYARFCREVDFLEENNTIPGILPLIDKNCPKNPTDDKPAWYIIPKAFRYYTKTNRSLEINIVRMLELAKTIQKLHERKTAHRDIKPENIMFYKGRLFLIDYGLVWISGKERLTIQEERIGPYKILPPELTRVVKENESIDFCASDVYLFAKVLWMYLMRDNEGFSGPYLRNREMIYIQLDQEYSNETKSLEPIHELLEKATFDDWGRRISIDECIQLLYLQLDIIRNNNSSDSKWETIISNLIYTENLHYVIANNEPFVREYSSLDTILKMLSSIIGQSCAMIVDTRTKKEIGSPKLFSSLFPDKENSIILRHNPGYGQTEQYRLCHIIMRCFPDTEIIELIPGDPAGTKKEDEIYYSNRERDLFAPIPRKYLLTPNEKIVIYKKNDNPFNQK